MWLASPRHITIIDARGLEDFGLFNFDVQTKEYMYRLFFSVWDVILERRHGFVWSGSKGIINIR